MPKNGSTVTVLSSKNSAAVRRVFGPIQDHLRSLDVALLSTFCLVLALMVLIVLLWIRVDKLEKRLYKEDNGPATPKVPGAIEVPEGTVWPIDGDTTEHLCYLSVACSS